MDVGWAAALLPVLGLLGLVWLLLPAPVRERTVHDRHSLAEPVITTAHEPIEEPVRVGPPGA